MRRILIAVLLALTACDAPENQLRQVTIESPEALGLSLREVPASALRSVGLAYGLSEIKAGSLAHMAIWRDGKRQTLELRVGEIAPEPAVAARQAPAKQEDPRLGMAVRELMPAERKNLGVDYGLVVVDVAQRSGPGSTILPGDVIVGVNQSRFASKQEFEKLINTRRKGEMVALLVRRGEVSLYVPVELG